MKYTKEIQSIQSEILLFSTDFFHKEGFTQIMPVMLSTITDPLGPDPNSSVIKTGDIEYCEQKLTLTQSMILHKQIAISKGLKKIFILSPNIRLEHPKRKTSGKHLFEFTQLDFEIKDAKMQDVFKLIERYYFELFKHLKKTKSKELKSLKRDLPKLTESFPRIRTTDLISKFGEDWESSASKEYKTPFWAISHKREFYDKSDPKKENEFLNYDLIYPEGFGEALSGGERDHKYEILLSKIKHDKLKLKRFEKYLKLAKNKKLKPTAGAGFGIERLTRFVCGLKHVGETQLFRRMPGEKVIF